LFGRVQEFPVRMLSLERLLPLPRRKLRVRLHVIRGVIIVLAYVTVRLGWLIRFWIVLRIHLDLDVLYVVLSFSLNCRFY